MLSIIVKRQKFFILFLHLLFHLNFWHRWRPIEPASLNGSVLDNRETHIILLVLVIPSLTFTFVNSAIFEYRCGQKTSAKFLTATDTAYSITYIIHLTNLVLLNVINLIWIAHGEQSYGLIISGLPILIRALFNIINYIIVVTTRHSSLKWL